MKIIENNRKVPIGEVRANKYNPKPDYSTSEELKAEFERIKTSLRIHGQIDPILVRTEKKVTGWEIVNGFHRWMAMKDLGFTEIEIKDLGEISRADAIKKALSTEEPRIPLDVIEVAKLIKEIKESEEGLEGLPYLEKEITEKLALLEFDFNQFGNPSEGNEAVKTEALTIIVTTAQREIIMKAMKKIMDENPQVQQGRALELICADYLAGAGTEE